MVLNTKKSEKKEEEAKKKAKKIRRYYCISLIIAFLICIIFFYFRNWIMGLIILGIAIILLYLMPGVEDRYDEEDDYHQNWI